MNDETWQRKEVDSPCVKICMIHPQTQLCTGCLRTMDEISSWSRMTPEGRQAIMAELPTRAPELKKRRGGRTARLSRG